jgi:hypothetical protein
VRLCLVVRVRIVRARANVYRLRQSLSGFGVCLPQLPDLPPKLFRKMAALWSGGDKECKALPAAYLQVALCSLTRRVKHAFSARARAHARMETSARTGMNV